MYNTLNLQEDIAISHGIYYNYVNGKTASEYCSKCNTVLKSSKKIYKASHINLSRTSYKYNGKKRTPKVVVCDSRENLISSKNYTVKYSKGRKNVGKYKVTVKFKGKKYSGSKTLYFEIKE